jgi:hypothetical protein
MYNVSNVSSWKRAPRSKLDLDHENGLYALFLRDGAKLPEIEPGQTGLIYIGKAAGRKGLKGRCHFDGKTTNHSPRKSLAFLLNEELSLTPKLVTKLRSASTWTLEPKSEARLTAWMHDNLLLAIARLDQPHAKEQELINRFSPPLNLTGCPQTERHRLISGGRKTMMARASGLLPMKDPPMNLDEMAQAPLRRALNEARKGLSTGAMTSGGMEASLQSPDMPIPTTKSVTLHEEISDILRVEGNRWLTTKEVAVLVNKRALYEKRDGSPVTEFQIHGRTRNYSLLFERDGQRVRLVKA